MKILICTDAMGYGGAETHILSLAGELTKSGHRVTVAAPRGALANALPAGVKFVPLPPFRRTPWGLLRSRRRLAKLAHSGFDIIHAHARLPALLLRVAARRNHIPLVVTAHAMFRMTPLLARLSVWGERTIAVSQDIKQMLADRCGLWPDHISVISNGIDTTRFCPRPSTTMAEISAELCTVTPTETENFPQNVPQATGFPHIIFVSRLDHDCSSAASALCRLAGRLRGEFSGATITIVGGGDRYTELASLAELMNTVCGDRVVRMTGARGDIESLLRQADIFVGVSRAAMEAAACGLPVILAGDEGYGGIFAPDESESIADSTNLCARAAPKTDTKALSELLFADICRLARLDVEQRKKLGLAGREFIIRHHSASAAAEKTLEVYRSAAALHVRAHPRVVICGGMGHGNLGLDAAGDVLIARLRAAGLRPSEICMITKKHRRAERRFGVKCVGRHNFFAIRHSLGRATILLLGGGSLIQQWHGNLRYYRRLATFASRKGMGVMIWGAGLGPMYGETARRQAALLLNSAGCVVLREPLALDIAHSLGVRLDGGSVYADPALLTPPCEVGRTAFLLGGDGPFFAVSLRSPEHTGVHDPGREEQHRLMRIAAALDGIAQVCGAEALFLITSPDDRRITDAVRRLMERPGRVLGNITPGEAVGILSRCLVTVSMRLHVLEFSFIAGVPAVAIGNTPEILGFMSYAGLAAPLPATLTAPGELISLASSAAFSGRRGTADTERRARLIELADAGMKKVTDIVGVASGK